MAHDQATRAAGRILDGIEQGNLSANESFALVEDADPALVYLIFTWLRKRYADHANADAVIGRLLAISNRGTVPAMMKEGAADPVARWFEEAYAYRDLDADAFLALVVDKLES